MDSSRAGTPAFVLWAQIIAMMVLGMVFALALGYFFSDELLTRFVRLA